MAKHTASSNLFGGYSFPLPITPANATFVSEARYQPL